MLRRLKGDYGAEIHLYTATAQEADYYRRLDSQRLFASISVANTLYDACEKPVTDPVAVIENARALEVELGYTMNELALTDRHLGRGYSLGGFRHPRSRTSEETSYLQMLAGFSAQVEFWQREIDDKKPWLILQAGKSLSILARKHSIAMRTLAGSRYKNYYYWATDEFFSNPSLQPAYEKAEPDLSLTLEAPYASHLRFREKFRSDASLGKTLKSSVRLLAMYAYWNLRGYEKAKGYYLSENLGFTWRKSRDIRRLAGAGMPSLSDLKSMPYVFFPLATEPEVALQVLSPEYFFQLETIALVSRDLPAGTLLAVKEHYAATGRRPIDFHAQIAEFKNVRLIDMAELGLDAVRGSAAVVTITGTSGFEGAVLGKPVITFGRHNLYGFLPHVSVVNTFDDLKPALAAALASDFDAARARADGSRFLKAIMETSFDLRGFQPINPTEIDDEAVEAAYSNLLQGLEPLPRASAHMPSATVPEIT